ncbi:MAG: RNA polymerase sigma factor [Planctomycetota bacterium]
MQNNLERQLVDAAVGGDIESFGELCRRYYAAMAAIAYAVVSDHQLAEDVAQESFARALVRIKSLKERAKFAPWLAAICRNVAKDMIAAKAKRISTEDISHVEELANHDEHDRAIRRAIEQLPESAKDLVVLRYYDGLSYEQISSVLGISKASINGRLTRAKRKMADYLKRSGFPENRL